MCRPIPLFETVTPEYMQGGTDGKGGVLRNAVLQQTQIRIILSFIAFRMFICVTGYQHNLDEQSLCNNVNPETSDRSCCCLCCTVR